MSKAKVLIVEDDASIGLVVSAALSAEDIEVQLCDSVGARDVALSNGHFDLMLTDVVLKDSDGLATLKELMMATPDMPVIIMSAQNTLETAVRASEINAFEYFPKPFDLNDLVLAVKQGIEKRRSSPTEAGDTLAEANLPMIGRSVAMQDVYRMVARLLRNDLSVLISGESGTGKELVAEAIHSLGHRKTGPFVAVNMAAIPGELIEAELFGHEKGSFTGAVGQSIGRFEQAQGGTLFLDEIGDMPKHAQTRLLRALQSGVISRIGGKASIRLDVRILAATNQNLEELIAKGKFREDLFYRLNVVPIDMPPLRDRTDDIGLLAQHFLLLAAKEGLPVRQIDDAAIAMLMTMPWRGNIRELKNLIYRLALVCREDVITEATVAQYVEPPQEVEAAVRGASFEAAVTQFLREHRLRGNARAAALLGINRNTLRKKLTDYGIGPNGLS
jgi:two-component system, NtrC family, nitrogen regulation response regulator GlnG